MNTQKNVGVGVGLVLVSGLAFGAMYGYGPAEGWTISEIAKETASVSQTIATFGTTFASNMQMKAEQVISAVAVATKQEALSANVVSDSSRQAAEQLVNAVRAQKQTDQVADAVLNYNAMTGQGFDPCGTNAKNQSMDIAFDNARVRARAAIGLTESAPGRLVSSSAEVMQARLALHRSKFCTPSEAAAGLCTVSSLPGGDTNAALLFEPADPGSLKVQARAAYLQHVLGQPDDAIPADAGATPAGEAFLVAKNRKDALLSVPAYSLAMINEANTRVETMGGKSPNEILRLRVNQYFGGKEAEQWSGALARQQPRGLLVEAVKMAGLEVWLHHKQYEQNQRLEANLAALVLVKGDRMAGSLAQQHLRVVSEVVKQQVK